MPVYIIKVIDLKGENTMKKNRMMRIAAVVAVLALLTTCIISGSFAKYVTTGNAASDTARVAKWGVKVEASSSLALADVSYTANGTYNDASGNAISATVAATNGTDEIMAPGTTKSDVAVITLSGTPEVAVSVAYTGTVTLDGWTLSNNSFYCPLKFTIGSTVIEGATYTDKATLKSDLEAALTSTVNYAPNTNLSTINAGKTVKWEWPFTVENSGVSNDAKDTELGSKSVAPTISISLSATVTQLD